MRLSEQELICIQDIDFLLTKGKVLNKVRGQLEETRTALSPIIREANLPFLTENSRSSGKISRGENYRFLPYMVLDFPGHFKNGDIFTYRTMFWWGHFFSFTLHLQGIYLEAYKSSILSKLDHLLGKDIYIGTGKAPWQYHYGSDNYQLLAGEHKDHIQNSQFLKLSKKIPLSSYSEVPGKAVDYFKFILKLIDPL